MNNITRIKRPKKDPVIPHNFENDSDKKDILYDYSIGGHFLLGSSNFKSKFSFDVLKCNVKIEDLHDFIRNFFIESKMELTEIIKKDAKVEEVYKSMPEPKKIVPEPPKKRTFWQNLWTNY